MTKKYIGWLIYFFNIVIKICIIKRGKVTGKEIDKEEVISQT